jgi:hypothetical protein
LRALGDVYVDQTRFDEAVRIYQLVQDRFPSHPDFPDADVQEKIVTALERSRAFELAAEARETLTRTIRSGLLGMRRTATTRKP